MTKGPWYREYDTNQCADYRENDGAERMIREGVEDFCGGKDMETDEKNVVGEQHEAAEFISKPALSKDVISKIACERSLVVVTFIGLPHPLTNILDLRVFHNVLVHGYRSDPEEDTGENHGDDSWNPS